MSNAGQHAEASKVTVTIKSQGDIILFKVEDNGRGFNAEEVMKLEPCPPIRVGGHGGAGGDPGGQSEHREPGREGHRD